MNTGVYQVMGIIAQNDGGPEEFFDVNYGYKDKGEKTFRNALVGNSSIKIRIFKDNTFTPNIASVQNKLQTILERFFVDMTFFDGYKQRPATSLWELITSKEDGDNGNPPMIVNSIKEVPFAIGKGGVLQVPEIKQWEIELEL